MNTLALDSIGKAQPVLAAPALPRPLALVGACLVISFAASTALFSDFSEALRIVWSLGSIVTSFIVVQVCIVYFRSQAGVRVQP